MLNFILVSFCRMLEHSFSRLFIPRNIRSHDGTFILGTIRSLELSFQLPGPFLLRTIRSFVSRTCWSTYKEEQHNKQKRRPMTATVHSRYTQTIDRTTTLRGGTTGWTVAVDGAIWTCTSWPRFCSRSLRTSASRLHWCLSHVCAGTSGRPISACKGGWRQCGRHTRP